jgi:hypothetical protein
VTKQIPESIVFEIRLETHYAQRVVSPDLALETFWKPPSEVTYEQFPENHSRFQTFLSISNVLENAASKYEAKWTMEKVRKELSEEQRNKYDGRAYLDGAYSDLLYQVGTLTSTAVAAIGLLKAIQPSLVQWLKNRGPRMLRVKIGTSEISVQGEQDIEKLLQLVKNVTHDNAPEGEPTPKARKRRSRKSKKQAVASKAKLRPSR